MEVKFEMKTSYLILKLNIYLYYAHLYNSHWIPCHHTLSLDRSRYSLCRLCIPIHPHEHKNSSYYRYSSDLHNRVVGRQIQAKILIIIASLCTLPNDCRIKDPSISPSKFLWKFTLYCDVFFACRNIKYYIITSVGSS